MSKESSPAFQFYVKDFISGTVHMTTEEVGAYIRLLCFQWEHGSIPDDKKVLIRISGAKKGAIDEVLKKFKQTEQGLINLRLNVTREEQLAYREKQRLNGGKGGRPKNETQINPVVNFGLQNSEPNTEPKKSSSPSSSSSINTICVRAREATSEFFKISEMKNARTWIDVSNALQIIDSTGRIEYYLSQLQAYKEFKNHSGQQSCNVITWIWGEKIGSRDIESGHWCREDYSEKFKSLANATKPINQRNSKNEGLNLHAGKQNF